jgi:hypothetical protein
VLGQQGGFGGREDMPESAVAVGFGADVGVGAEGPAKYAAHRARVRETMTVRMPAACSTAMPSAAPGASGMWV